MTKADEVFAQAVRDLRLWLDYLEVKQTEYQEQMERARRKEETTPPEPRVAGDNSFSGSLPGNHPLTTQGVQGVMEAADQDAIPDWA